MKAASRETEEIKEKALYDIKEVARILKVGRSTVLRLIQNGELPVAKVGRQYRILGYYILDYVLRNIKAKDKIEFVKEEVSWGKRLEDITSRIRKKTVKYSAKEIEADISEALKEVRAKRGRRSA